MNLRNKAPKCDECGGRLSHKLDCSKRDRRPEPPRDE